LVAADDRNVITWSLTAGQAGDAPEGRRLIEQLGPHHERVALLMDSAYQDNATRELAHGMGFVPVVPPNPQRRRPWDYDKQIYRQRNRDRALVSAHQGLAPSLHALRQARHGVCRIHHRSAYSGDFEIVLTRPKAQV
jgi:hypothetical protein